MYKFKEVEKYVEKIAEKQNDKDIFGRYVHKRYECAVDEFNCMVDDIYLQLDNGNFAFEVPETGEEVKYKKCHTICVVLGKTWDDFSFEVRSTGTGSIKYLNIIFEFIYRMVRADIKSLGHSAIRFLPTDDKRTTVYIMGIKKMARKYGYKYKWTVDNNDYIVVYIY